MKGGSFPALPRPVCALGIVPLRGSRPCCEWHVSVLWLRGVAMWSDRPVLLRLGPDGWHGRGPSYEHSSALCLAVTAHSEGRCRAVAGPGASPSKEALRPAPMAGDHAGKANAVPGLFRLRACNTLPFARSLRWAATARLLTMAPKQATSLHAVQASDPSHKVSLSQLVVN